MRNNTILNYSYNSLAKTLIKNPPQKISRWIFFITKNIFTSELPRRKLQQRLP